MTNANKPRRKLPLKWRLAAVFMSSFVALLVAEVALRACGVSYPQLYDTDEHCASKLLPGFSGVWTKEGFAAIKVNQFGFRDREWSIKRTQASTIRIAILGDSYIEALQVSDDERFGSVLERLLNEKRDHGMPNYEVLSFGVSGWGTVNQLQALRNHVWQFDPDVILLAFLSANDIRNNSRELEAEKCRPFFGLVDNELVLDQSFRDLSVYQKSNSPSARLRRRIINASRILQVTRQVVSSIRDKCETHSGIPNHSPLAASEIGLDNESFRPPASPEWIHAWNVTDRLIEEMHREINNRGKSFVVMCVTSGQQVHPDPQIRKAFAKSLSVPDLAYPERRLQALGDRRGFRIIGLATPLSEYAHQHQEYLHGFSNTLPGQGHWNAAGHRVAAQIVAEQLPLPTSASIRVAPGAESTDE